MLIVRIHVIYWGMRNRVNTHTVDLHERRVAREEDCVAAAAAAAERQSSISNRSGSDTWKTFSIVSFDLLVQKKKSQIHEEKTKVDRNRKR